MALSPEIRDQAYQFFIEEATELLQVIEMGLLDLRHGRDTAKIHEVMRAAHSIKGGAASVELPAIKTIAHRLESIFKALYSDRVIFTSELETALLQGYDRLRQPLEQQISQGYLDETAALEAAEPVLIHLETLLGPALQESENYIPSSSDLGIDIVASIFEVDVAQGLDRLAAVCRNPEAYPIAGELRAQLEVFSGLGEILNLPGFSALTHTVMQALDRHPDQAYEILQVSLEDFQRAKDSVLGGDRHEGGSPGAALLALAETPAAEIPAAEIPGADLFQTLDPLNASVNASDLFNPEAAADFWASWSDPATPELGAYDLTASDVTNSEITGAEVPADWPPLSPSPGVDFWGDPLFPAGDPISPLDSVPSLEDVFGTADFPLDPLPFNALSLESLVSDFQQPEITTNENSHEHIVSEDLTDTIGHNADSNFSNLSEHISKNLTEEITQKFGQNLREKLIAITPSKNRSKPTVQRGGGGPTIRVPLERLNQMNNLVGELVISRNSISLQNDQLQGVVRELTERFSRFQDLLNQLRQTADQMLVEPNGYGTPKGTGKSPSETIGDWTQGFDALEMDRYNTLHAQVQAISEEVFQLEEAVGDISLFAGFSNQTLNRQRQQLNQVQTEFMWARMLPLGDVLNRFPRILRDLSNEYQKTVQLKLLGTGVLVDKRILEKLYDPLLHLLRNAFDHGIEPPADRLAQGKPETGTIELEAYHRGNQTFIEIRDDGRGINLEKVKQRAMALGWLTPEDPDLKPEQCFNFLFEPGFSTAAQVTEISGRGVGLDVVKSQLQELKGSVEVSSIPQQGTTFTLKLPLTLTIAKLLTIVVKSTLLALPSSSIEEILVPRSGSLQRVNEQTFLLWRDQQVPFYHLAQLVRYHSPLPDLPNLKAMGAIPTPADWAAPVLVVRCGTQTFALQVDSLLTEQELVIKPFGGAIDPPPYVYGCTILSDGRLVPVMDVAVLLDPFLKDTAPAIVPYAPEEKAPVLPSVATLLVVDDSTALRRTLALSLQKAGYRIFQARDGAEALSQLATLPIDLVICDVEMPNMNGFEFLSQRRRDDRYRNIPVFMLTSRSNDKHRRLALQLGAAQYFSKPYIESELLKAIRETLQETDE